MPSAVMPTYNSIAKELDGWTTSGTKKSEISQYINACLSAGYITQSQAQKLKSIYVPKGYTY